MKAPLKFEKYINVWRIGQVEQMSWYQIWKYKHENTVDSVFLRYLHHDISNQLPQCWVSISPFVVW